MYFPNDSYDNGDGLLTLRQQIEATLEPNQFLQVVPAVGSRDKTNPRDWNAQIITENETSIGRTGTYGKTPEAALQNLTNMLGIVPALEVKVDASGVLRDLKRQATALCILMFLLGAVTGGAFIGYYDQKIVDSHGYLVENK